MGVLLSQLHEYVKPDSKHSLPPIISPFQLMPWSAHWSEHSETFDALFRRDSYSWERDDTISIGCDNETFRISRSTRLTFDDLKAKVAQYMLCEPRQLSLLSTDLDLDLQTHASQIDNITLMSAKYMHFRCMDVAETCPETDDPMEDVRF